MDELKRTLRERAEEMRLDPEMPAGLRRRARNRRVLNGAIALAVVGALGFGSYAGFRIALDQTGLSRPVRPASTEYDRIPALYPAPHLIPEIQRDADSGVAPEWLDPRLVTLRFAGDVLGWTEDETHVRLLNPDPMRIEIWNKTLIVGGRRLSTILSMQRYENREDGIYMVMEARAPDIEIDAPRPWAPIRPGQQVHVQGRLGFNHEGGGLEASIRTAPGGIPSVRGIGYRPDFTFSLVAPTARAVAATFAMYSAEGTTVAMTAFRVQGFGDDSADEPGAEPTPGPTPTTDDAVPSEVPRVVRNFMKWRILGTSAEGYLTEEALEIYRRGEGYISLYNYTAHPGAGFEITAVYQDQDQYRAVVRITEEDSTRLRHETLTLERQESAEHGWLIVDAERNE